MAESEDMTKRGGRGRRCCPPTGLTSGWELNHDHPQLLPPPHPGRGVNRRPSAPSGRPEEDAKCGFDALSVVLSGGKIKSGRLGLSPPRRPSMDELGRGDRLSSVMEKGSWLLKVWTKGMFLACLEECPASLLHGRAWPSIGEHGGD